MADEYITKEQAKVAFDDSLRLSAQEWNMIFEGIDNLPSADVAPGSDFRDCRNELCLQCGQYKTAHLGSCDDCRWRH